jgi:hypothetical protein
LSPSRQNKMFRNNTIWLEGELPSIWELPEAIWDLLNQDG